MSALVPLLWCPICIGTSSGGGSFIMTSSFTSETKSCNMSHWTVIELYVCRWVWMCLCVLACSCICHLSVSVVDITYIRCVFILLSDFCECIIWKEVKFYWVTHTLFLFCLFLKLISWNWCVQLYSFCLYGEVSLFKSSNGLHFVCAAIWHRFACTGRREAHRFVKHATTTSRCFRWAGLKLNKC